MILTLLDTAYPYYLVYSRLNRSIAPTPCNFIFSSEVIQPGRRGFGPTPSGGQSNAVVQCNIGLIDAFTKGWCPKDTLQGLWGLYSY